MRFEYQGTSYLIEFERQHRQLRRFKTTITQDENGQPVESVEEYFVPSKFPDTKARIVQILPDGTKATFREHVVGCWNKEPNFSPEKGRLRALRIITTALPREMKPLLWKAYHGRFAKK